MAPRRAVPTARPQKRAVSAAAAAEPTQGQVDRGHGGKGAAGWKGEPLGSVLQDRMPLLNNATCSVKAVDACHGCAEIEAPVSFATRPANQPLTPAAAAGYTSPTELKPRFESMLLTYGELVQVSWELKQHS